MCGGMEMLVKKKPHKNDIRLPELNGRMSSVKEKKINNDVEHYFVFFF